MGPANPNGTGGDDHFTDEAVQLVAHWLGTTDRERDGPGPSPTLKRLVEDRDGLAFAMRFADRVVRPEDPEVAADQVATLVGRHRVPGFLKSTDRLALRGGGSLARRAPSLVMPLARRRMRQMVDRLVVDADPGVLGAHLAARRGAGYDLTVTPLGEAVLGAGAADRRLEATADLIDRSEVSDVSIALSSIVPPLNPWDRHGDLIRVVERLRLLHRRAGGTFLHLDMGAYHEFELTLAAFRTLLDEPELRGTEAGITLQAYLPDSYRALRDLAIWAGHRVDQGGAPIRIRLVKGANLGMERVEAAIRGWAQAPYTSRADVDANFKRCLDWALRPELTGLARIGVASHNLFDLAWALLLAHRRGVGHRVGFEMVQGMAPAQAPMVRDASGTGLLLYTPTVAERDFDVAIGYLFRRLDEHAAPGGFLRSVFDLSPGSEAFRVEEARFRAAVAERWTVDDRPRRAQGRPAPGAWAGLVDGVDGRFVNEPDTDPALASNRAWMAQVVATRPGRCRTPPTTSVDGVLDVVGRARDASVRWAVTPPAERRLICHDIADQVARRRGPLISALIHEAGRTVGDADPEVSTAVDLARYYGDRAPELESWPGSTRLAAFTPLGVLAVAAPWSAPVATSLGGIVAALASGNTAILKPAPETPRCAELLLAACEAADLPDGVLQLIRTPDDAVGRALIESVDGVILTGSIGTARLFRSWRPDLALFAGTSGKGSMVITPNADLDLAVADLVRSAFGQGGQRCSAVSLAICVGGVERSERFRRQLVDATRSLRVGPADDQASVIGPLIAPPGPDLARALTGLEPGESWLVEPRQLDTAGRFWTPGVRTGVRPGSWFHRTECFGPVLGIVAVADLDEAIAVQNDVESGLTGGIQSLDDDEVDRWLDRVEVGCANVNRPTTGAVVSRQPFGGWKRSSVGPGALTGGPNYLHQLGRWRPRRLPAQTDEDFLEAAKASDQAWWDAEMAVARDRAGLVVESNVFRYRSLAGIVVRAGLDASPAELDRVLSAAERAGVPVVLSRAGQETEAALIERLDTRSTRPRGGPDRSADRFDRIRCIGQIGPELRRLAAARDIHLIEDPVTAEGRIELRHYVREQAISRTVHRFGTVVAAPDAWGTGPAVSVSGAGPGGSR